jgi:hypothetical protein
MGPFWNEDAKQYLLGDDGDGENNDHTVRQFNRVPILFSSLAYRRRAAKVEAPGATGPVIMP